MAITVDGTLEPASVTLTLSPGSEPFPSSVTFEALNGNGDVGTGAAQVAAGDHGHAGVYEPADPDIAKLDTAQTWTATQAFTTITGTAVTVSLSPGSVSFRSVSLDGRCHVFELGDGTDLTITGVPGAGFSNCLVRIKQPAVGSGTISWAAGHRFMGGSELNTASDSFSDFMLDSHDGSTVLYRGVGVEP